VRFHFYFLATMEPQFRSAKRSNSRRRQDERSESVRIFGDVRVVGAELFFDQRKRAFSMGKQCVPYEKHECIF